MLYINIMYKNFLFALPLFFLLLVIFHILKEKELEKRRRNLEELTNLFSKKLKLQERDFLKTLDKQSEEIVYFQKNDSYEEVREFLLIYKNIMLCQKEIIEIAYSLSTEEYSTAKYNFKLQEPLKTDLPVFKTSIHDKTEIKNLAFTLKKNGGHNLCYN